MVIAERIENLADAHREAVVLLFDYRKHHWSLWIGLAKVKAIHLGLTADEALAKAEQALEASEE